MTRDSASTTAFIHPTKQRKQYIQIGHNIKIDDRLPSDSTSTTSLPSSSSMVIRSESITNNSPVSVSSVNLRSDASTRKPHTNSVKTHHHHNHKSNDWLKGLGLPRGLRDTLLRHIQEVSCKRIWIVDNSGSMKILDGHEILTSSSSSSLSVEGHKNNNKNLAATTNTRLKPKIISSTSNISSSTRWAEVQETVNCHAQLSSVLGAPTDFRLLNPPSNGGPQKFRAGYDNSVSNSSTNKMIPSMSIFRKRQSDSQRVEKIMNRNKPAGRTPLHTAVLDVRKEVIRMLPQLRADGMKVTIVICTDGSTNSDATSPYNNQELEDALQSLSGLPVCVVIRLCTDYDYVVDFYNGLHERMSSASDSNNQFLLDVLDDYESEAKQVYNHNPWLNYALVLHRMREMGLQGSSELLDYLHQRSFTSDEIRSFCALLFGTTFDLLPDPLCDEDNFVSEIDCLQQIEKQLHWNPNTNCMSSWIDIKELSLALR